MLARRTSLYAANRRYSPETTEIGDYELVPCPNHFRVTESLSSLNDDVFHSTKEDNEVSLSCEDRKFIEIMERGAHKNGKGNLEMPLPFRQERVRMPNNRAQAVHRLNGLLRTLRRKPQMQTEYLNFMEKILEKVADPT